MTSYLNKEKIKKIHTEKELAIKNRDFERAAKLRDEENKLCESSGIIPENSCKNDISSKEVLKNIVVVFSLLCLSSGYFLHLLFYKKEMWHREVGNVKISSSDPLFWIYAAAVMMPLVVFVILTCNYFAKKRQDGKIKSLR
jgi:hypothetical protein